jgi:hypothetical protein
VSVIPTVGGPRPILDVRTSEAMAQVGRAAVLESFGADFVVREYPVLAPEPGALYG